MISIALVDDELIALQQLQKMLDDFACEKNTELSIKSFNCSQALFDNGIDDFDIIYLDIEMPGMNGMQAAHHIRETNSKVIIIFCTNIVQYAVNGYEVNALGYLIKPVQAYPFRYFLEKACKIIENRQQQKIAIKTIHSRELINISDIQYIEIQRHNLFFFLIKKGVKTEIRTRGSMQETANQLKSSNFGRCSACYLVNFNKILSVENNTVKMEGQSLAISRTFKSEFSESFMRFLVENEMVNTNDL